LRPAPTPTAPGAARCVSQCKELGRQPTPQLLAQLLLVVFLVLDEILPIFLPVFDELLPILLPIFDELLAFFPHDDDLLPGILTSLAPVAERARHPRVGTYGERRPVPMPPAARRLQERSFVPAIGEVRTITG
jgi:hypothetical protein